jgi:hypothetical protein
MKTLGAAAVWSDQKRPSTAPFDASTLAAEGADTFELAFGKK